MDSFYETAASFCFTLLGLWWTIVQFRFDAWMHNPRSRRMVHSIHLTFLLPGAMSLGALTGGDNRLIWQIVFSIAGICGVLATLIALPVRPGLLWRAGHLLQCLVYLLVVAVALNPQLVAWLGLALAPLQLEGLLLTLVVVLGVNFAWTVLTSLHT